MPRTIVRALLLLGLAAGAGLAAGRPGPAMKPAVIPAGIHNQRVGNVDGLRSVFAAPEGPEYRFAAIPASEPESGWLLVGALLAGGFIIRRRLADG